MNQNWSTEDRSFYPERNFQRNPQRFIANNVQKFKAKAYVNPQMVNYEFIQRSLTGNSLQRGNKIHVNPNFKSSRLNNVTNENPPYLINMVQSQNSLLCRPGTSNASSIAEENITNFSLAKTNTNLTHTSYQPCLKKNNLINSNKYTWSKSNQHVEKSNIKCNENSYKYTSPEKTICSNTKNSVVYKSRTKLVNKSPSKNKSHFKSKITQSPMKGSNFTKFKLIKNKKSAALRVAKAVQSKYKYLKNSEYKKSKYKIDKRNKLLETGKRKTSSSEVIKDIRKLFPNYFYNKKRPLYNIYNVNNCVAVSKTNWRKNDCDSKVTKNQFPNKQVVKIGGILYKSTTNKLILANKKVENNSKKAVTNKSKAKSRHAVYVRGERFILEKNGKALRRQSDKANNLKTPLLTLKRIDIGGVTYLRKSHNVLIRTNVHQTRQLVNKAKNKSIALLANLHKRSSMPCMIYHRFGKCNRHIKGLCMYKHDSKNITVCKKFLKGNCDDKKCLLSHEIIQEKMATCHFFLKGLCVRENCPYLHVKLNKNAAICKNFLQGFCNLGKECSKRHLHQCPEFDKYGKCNQGAKCRYPHKKSKKLKETKEQKEGQQNSENLEELKKQKEVLQYYIHSNVQKKEKKTRRSFNKAKSVAAKKLQTKTTKKKSLSFQSADQSIHAIECFPKRIKLDKLPCFIPLSFDS